MGGAAHGAGGDLPGAADSLHHLQLLRESLCPNRIGISGQRTAMNYLMLYNNLDAAKYQENWLVARYGLKKAAECVRCGQCEQVCPQHIPIREELKKVVQTLG